MTDLVVRPLVAGEENVFDSMPDPLPQLRQPSYASGLASGGFHPDRTWIALRGGQVVGRAAWLLPPGAVGEPWLERFDLAAEPEVGQALLHAAHAALGGAKPYYATMPPRWRDRPDVLAAVEAPMAAARLAGLVERAERIRFAWAASTPTPTASGRLEFRPASAAEEINALVAGIDEPVLVTGVEAARLVRGVDLARKPLDWLTGPPQDWRIALRGGEPVGLAAAAGDACYPMIAYLGVLGEGVLGELLADSARALAANGALEVVADVDADRPSVIAEVERIGFVAVRSRLLFDPSQ
ncbi:N-acetyltransferase [Rhizocola hellebori]|uniref:N-acetyltransferase n=1 Tax=Rhizocola hellebori TaxID=1392758 RepID=A0A8J3Q816_9ACTN|nr:acetyltransferase [Rhizocola hellebori]GIH05581.1 N-acetyltransferase [Rhizocola hellebori]